MKRIIVFILTTISFMGATAQNKNQKFFKMPTGAAYEQGRVLVKIKSEFKDDISLLTAKNTGAQIKDVEVKSIAHLVKPEKLFSARAQKPTVDISRYFTLKFNPNEKVEDYINKLYATGYFEIVEPEYKYHTAYTPNDPSINQQYYLGLIKAFDAWDITKGDTSIVVAIVDSGGNLTHSDIAPNLFRNWHEIPNNGIDDDGNGFVDDYRGWDFIGTDTLNIYKPGFIGDNDPSVKNGGDISHGTWAAGCASAATNNNNGIAGVGYKTKLMFTKHSADDQRPTDPSVLSPYEGMLYAANLFHLHNIRGIINCSFGGSGQSQIIQDLISHIVLDLNCLVVASAGNDGTNAPNYPAAYDNVLSVAATNASDLKASFSSYGTTVDISAPGVNIYTTGYDNIYNTVSGTSFSSPLTAGAAALVWAKNPAFTAQQVGEQLRVTADASSLYAANQSRVNQLGNGRLDILRALTLVLPSIRALKPKLVNQNGFSPALGEKAFLTFDFKNYLKATTGLQISISTTSSAIAITKGTISPGIISTGSTFRNSLSPFELTVQASAAQNSVVNLLINYSDGVYTDYQWISFVVNPSYIDVASNLVQTTVTSIGRLGFQDPKNSAQGIGFYFNNNQLLYEMGIIIGTDSTTHLYNNVRGMNGAFDQDFASSASIKQIIPGVRSYSEVFGQFKDVLSQAVVIDYRSMVMKDTPYDKFVILEYKVKNPTANPITNFHFGIFSDWDISANGQQDAAAWDATNKLGYVYPAKTTSFPHAGIQLLTGSPNYYAIDNDQTIVGNPFGLYDGFSRGEKFKTITTNRLQAGQTTASGNDVSHVVSSGPYSIAAGETITIAFALHAANNFPELQTSARYADSLYNYTMLAPKPVANSVSTCYNTQATLNASGATKIKWYKTFTGGQPFYTGAQYITGTLKNDTAFYVSNADHTYESVRTAINVALKANPKIITSGSTAICQGDMITLSVAPADSTIWNTGAKTNSIDVTTAGKYAVRLKDNTLSCVSKSDTVVVTVKPKPTANFTVSSTDLRTQLPISFTDQSINAVSWSWDFGDGNSSIDQNPVHIFAKPSSSVKLTVTAANGCSDTKTNSVAIVTAVKDSQLSDFTIYPNPVSHHDLHIVIDNEDMNQARMILTNSVGQVIIDRDISTSGTHLEVIIPSASLNQGLNFVKVNLGGKTVTKKVVKVQ